MTISDIDRAISRLSQPLRELEHFIKSVLSPFCERFSYPFISRIKPEQSIAQKIETGRYRKMSEIDDLVAFTIIIPTGSHEDKCVDFIKTNFDMIEIKSRAKSLNNPRQFTFDSTRLYCRQRVPAWEDDRCKNIYRIIFEVQIRTALEHAWVTATHDVVYKSGTIDWQKVRLAAQIKAQIETIDLIFNNFENFARTVEPLDWTEGAQKSVIISFFDRMHSEGYIPSEKMPTDKIRLSENASKTLSKIALTHLSESLESISEEIKKLYSEGFPQNLTLLQTFMLAATRAEKSSAATSRYTPHITKSFSGMFSEMSIWGNLFEYDF